jgi:hypothetical protein
MPDLFIRSSGAVPSYNAPIPLVPIGPLSTAKLQKIIIAAKGERLTKAEECEVLRKSVLLEFRCGLPQEA